MTTFPNSGKFFVTFSASGKGDTINQQQDYGLFVGGVLISQSHRTLDYDSSSAVRNIRQTMHTQAIILVTGAEVVEIRYKTDVGVFTVYERNLTLLQLM
jgi:hypothetical protein